MKLEHGLITQSGAMAAPSVAMVTGVTMIVLLVIEDQAARIAKAAAGLTQ